MMRKIKLVVIDPDPKDVFSSPNTRVYEEFPDGRRERVEVELHVEH